MVRLPTHLDSALFFKFYGILVKKGIRQGLMGFEQLLVIFVMNHTRIAVNQSDA